MPSTMSASVTADIGSPTAVGRGARFGAGRFRTDLEQPELVDVGQRTSAGADLDEVDRRHRTRESRPLLETVDTGDLEDVGQLGFAMVDQARLGGGTAHVETEQPLLAEPLREPAAGERTGRRAALDEPDRYTRRVVGRHDSAVRQHHQHRAAEALARQPLLEFVEVRSDHGHGGGVARRGDHPRVLADLRRDVGRDTDRHAQLACEMVGDLALVRCVHVGVEQADTDGLDVHRAELLGDRRRSCSGRRLDEDLAERVGSFVDLDGALTRNRRRRELDLQVVHVVAMLVADQQRVAESRRGDESGSPGLALDQGVGDQRGRVHDRCGHIGGLHAGACAAAADAGAHTVERDCARRGERLVDDDIAARCVDEHDVGERSADVDGEAPVRAHDAPPFIDTPSRRRWPRPRSFAAAKSSRGGENTSRIQHSSYSSSPMNTESPCQTVAGARYASPSPRTLRVLGVGRRRSGSRAHRA